MTNVPPPLLGFNNNVRHRGRIFHIQTEDSGVKNPRIVTHLFADGGRIIKTTRTDYGEHVSRPDMQPFVRNLMKEQHKGMFTALRLGELDVLLEHACGAFELPLHVSKSPPPEALSAPPPAATSPSLLVTERVAADFETPPISSAFGDEERVSDRPGRAQSLSNPNLRRTVPSVPLRRDAPLDVDVAELDRMPTKLAPPPEVSSSPPRPPLAKGEPPPRPARAHSATDAPGTPAGLSRPSSRFAAVPSTSASSIFGDGAISEQSLDEVILSYLAEDLDGSSE